MQKLKALGCDLDVQMGGAGEIACRPVEAFDEPGADRVTADRKYDRSRRARGFQRQRGGCRDRDDDADLPAREIGGQFGQAVILFVGVDLFEIDVLAIDISAPAETAMKCGKPGRVIPGRGAAQHADHGYGLLPRAANGSSPIPPSSLMNARRFMDFCPADIGKANTAGELAQGRQRDSFVAGSMALPPCRRRMVQIASANTSAAATMIGIQ